MKFSIKDFFSKCDQENFIFRAVSVKSMHSILYSVTATRFLTTIPAIPHYFTDFKTRKKRKRVSNVLISSSVDFLFLRKKVSPSA